MFDNINLISSVNAKTMIIHGENDSIVPFEHGKELYLHVKNKHKFISVPTADHNNVLDVYMKQKGNDFCHDIQTFIKS